MHRRSYTYNEEIYRLAPIKERMILKAIDAGVPVERIAEARYVVRLMDKEKVNRFIRSRHSGMHGELEAIVASETVC